MPDHRNYVRIRIAIAVLLLTSLACNVGTTPPPDTTDPNAAPATQAPQQPVVASPTSELRPVATLNKSAGIKTGPGTEYDVQDQLPGGTVVGIIGINEDGTWYLVSYSGKSGWVSISDATPSSNEVLPVVSEPTPSSDNSGGGGLGTIAPNDNDISIEVSIVDGESTENGAISYPVGDTTDNVYVTPIGFDSAITSGNLVFTLDCTGGNAKVTYTGGSVASGSPGCNQTWTVLVTNAATQSQVKIYLNSIGYVTWTLLISHG